MGFRLGAEEVVVNGPKVAFKIFGLNVTETVILSWVVMAVIIGLVLFMTHNMSKDHPSKKQIVAEWIVETVNGMVRDAMGAKNLVYAPYMATIFSFSIFGSLISVLGLRPVTGDFSVTLTWALMTFFMIQYAKIKNDGVLGYIVGFSKPIALLTPINIISELATPVSMSIRHFGNVASGIVITQLLYFALTSLSRGLGMEAFPVFTIGVPAVLSVYFDLFTGFMQAFIFTMLTMANVGAAYPEEEQTAG
ncbi:MAG: F0F1 ATP synthase subunit A [Oscillospiraceae bacterium]|nr:F0F1 ATP synthase subunit A [Oscillospiraceae bacterium]MBR3536002.1 F0F1 ATP synthase subunit A [Oscillospiraceae bacterium]